MKNTASTFYCTLLFALVCGAGCSPQKSLAHRLKEADRVVVTNTAEHIGISVTGTDVEKVVQAITTGKKESPQIKAALAFKLEFYKGAEHLKTINTSGGVFWLESTPYSFTTDSMNDFYLRMRAENAVPAH